VAGLGSLVGHQQEAERIGGIEAQVERRASRAARAHARTHAMPLPAITSSRRAIADSLNRDKVPTGQGDSKWYAATVRGVLARSA